MIDNETTPALIMSYLYQMLSQGPSRSTNEMRKSGSDSLDKKEKEDSQRANKHPANEIWREWSSSFKHCNRLSTMVLVSVKLVGPDNNGRSQAEPTLLVDYPSSQDEGVGAGGQSMAC